LEAARLRRFKDGPECSDDDVIRLDSCKVARPGAVLASPLALSLPDHVVAFIVRLLVGLGPTSVSPAHCPLCDAPLLTPGAEQPWHAFSCVRLRRLGVTTRHNAAMLLLCKFARSHGVLCRLEPKDDSSLVPDGEFHLPGSTVLVDASGTHPHAASYRRRAIRVPGSALVSREHTKHAKYDAYALRAGAAFVPFAIDTYGRLGAEARKFIDEILRDSSLARPSPYSMTRSEFFAQLAATWHRHNALIVNQWLVRSQSLALRRHASAYRAR